MLTASLCLIQRVLYEMLIGFMLFLVLSRAVRRRRRAAAADILLTPPPPIVTDRRAAECRRRAGAVFVTCSRHVVHQLYVASFL